MSYEAVLNHKEMPELLFFQKVVAEIMAEVNELDEKPEIRYSAEFENIAYLENGDIKPVSIMSSGYQSILWMAMDFVFRLAFLNPEICDSKEAQGIILIDEIDMHLHPKWQWNVVQALEKTFPNVQFILATHSPFVISSCKNARLILIKEDQRIAYLPDAYGYTVQDVLEFRQESTLRPKEIDKLMNQFYSVLDNDNYVEAEIVLTRLSKKMGSDHSDVKKIKEELKLCRWVEDN